MNSPDPAARRGFPLAGYGRIPTHPPGRDRLDIAYACVAGAHLSSTWVNPREYEHVFAAHPDLAECDAQHAFWHPQEEEAS